MVKKFLLVTLILNIAMTLAAQTTGSFTDIRDGKTYKTVTIGTQTWMAENFAATFKDSAFTSNLEIIKWQSINTKIANYKVYGGLYEWKTAMSLCPPGWHLPADSEWTTLVNYLGGKNIAGNKLKETGNKHWQSPNKGATNESGFTALPGGGGFFIGSKIYTYQIIGGEGQWWSSTEIENTSESAMFSHMSALSSNIIQQRDSKDTYKSIRYIKGATKPIAKHFIGEKFGGGIIFKVTPDGLHGLIAETQDQGQSIFSLAEYRAEYHSGSDSILHSIPARKFYGWHLPNAEELDLLFHQKDVVGGFSDVLYWSSTKDKDDISHRAFSEGFGIGNKNSFPITSIHSIRAIREF